MHENAACDLRGRNYEQPTNSKACGTVRVCVCVRSRVKKTFSTDWVSHNSHSNGTDHPLVSAAVMSHVPVRFAQPNCEASAGEPDARLL